MFNNGQTNAGLIVRNAVNKLIPPRLSGQRYWIHDHTQAISVGTIFGSTSALRLTAFYIPEAITINALGTGIHAAGTSSIRIGIYDPDPTTYKPVGPALCTTAAIVNTTAGATIEGALESTTYTLAAGWHWFGVWGGDTTFTCDSTFSAINVHLLGSPVVTMRAQSQNNLNMSLNVFNNTTYASTGAFPTLMSGNVTVSYNNGSIMQPTGHYKVN